MIRRGLDRGMFLRYAGTMQTSALEPGSERNRIYWQTQARRLRRRLNLGWVLERARVPLMVVSVVGSLVIVAMRRSGVGWGPCASVMAIAFLAVLGVSVWMARASWVGLETAFARLDALMEGNSRLSAARQGVGEWPSPPPDSQRFIARWQIGRVISPWLLMGFLVAVAFQVPVRSVYARRAPLERPPNVQQVDELLAEIERNAVLAPENLEVFKAQLEQLKNKAPGEWYSHGSLEAAAQLKAGVESDMRSAEAQFTKLQEALDAVAGAQSAEQASSQDPAKLATAQEQLQAALNASASSPVALDPQLVRKLSECAKGQKGGDPKDLKELQERLQRARECANCKKSGFKGQGESSGKKPVPGGEGGGKDSADLEFSSRPTDLGTATEETLPQGDLSRALPGDTVAEKRLAPRAESSSGLNAPGAVEGHQSGAQAVWTQRPVSPAEQRRLRTFFEK